MIRVVPMASLGADHFGGAEAVDVTAGNLFQLVAALDRISPGFADGAGLKMSFAVNGTVVHDWAQKLPADCEVLIVPRIAGGQSRFAPDRSIRRLGKCGAERRR